MASRLFPIGVILITELSTANSLIVNMQRAVLFNMVLSTAVAVNPNVQKDYAELPAMGRASWDGIPSTTFIEKFFEHYPANMALILNPKLKGLMETLSRSALDHHLRKMRC